MAKLALLLCACLLVGAATAEFNLLDPSSWVDSLFASTDLEDWEKPDFCGNSECPPYKLEKRTDNYEIRTYEGGKWVTTEVKDNKYELAYTKATARLIKYFKGGNDNKTSLELTTPTLAHLKLDKEGDGTERDYTFAYWIPPQAQKDTPQPADADIKIVDFKEIKVYVRTFSGFATESTILDNAHSLFDTLKDDDQDFDTDAVAVAVYDPPQKLIRRHNEVHVVVTDKAQPQKAARAQLARH
ncbi:hypothetical protein N2152v2_001313 [Parachlorella kessleri]